MAFVIEFDNEFERQMPHRTTDHGRTQGQGKVPWLVSMAMWSTCMRFITTEGITVGELARRARTGTNLAGMQRWGYVTIAPDPAGTRPKPPRSGWVIRATASGRRAQQVWLSGGSKEGISMALGILAKHGLAVFGPATDGGRGAGGHADPEGP